MRHRQIAEEQIETDARHEKAAFNERKLREVEARAKQQPMLAESEVSIAVQTNQGNAEYHRSLQQAAQIGALADAEAEAGAHRHCAGHGHREARARLWRPALPGGAAGDEPLVGLRTATSK